MSAHRSIANVLGWIAFEQDAWATTKYGPDDEDARTRALLLDAAGRGARDAIRDDMGWCLRSGNYLSRALTLGLDTPAGMQAMLKYASTAVALAASALRLYPTLEVLPRPGVPSGEGLNEGGEA